MVQIDRMALADIGNSVAIAHAILQQLGEVALPVPITEIAVASGISEVAAYETKGFEGALLASDHKATGVIVVNSASIPQRRRFTIGHELAHFLTPWHKPPTGGFKCTKSDMTVNSAQDGNKQKKMEMEANQFSAEILMPKKQFSRDLRKTRSPGLEYIVELAEIYDTSKLATTHRFVDLHDEITAYILSKDGVVEHSYRHKEFPFIELNRGQSVSAKSATATFNAVEDYCSENDIVEPSLWISKSLRRGAEMFEQVLIQSSGYRITLLSIDESSCEDDEEEYSRERSEQEPRFR